MGTDRNGVAMLAEAFEKLDEASGERVSGPIEEVS